MAGAAFALLVFLAAITPPPATGQFFCDNTYIRDGIFHVKSRSCEADARELNARTGSSFLCDGRNADELLSESCTADAGKLNEKVGASSFACAQEYILTIPGNQYCNEMTKRLNTKFLGIARTDCKKDHGQDANREVGCACNGQTNELGDGGADCTSVSEGEPFCYTDVGVCADGQASSKFGGVEFSYTACLKTTSEAGKTGNVTDTGTCECGPGLTYAISACVQSKTAAAKEEQDAYNVFYYAAAATVGPVFLGTGAFAAFWLGPVPGFTIAVLVSARIFDMETDWALYALSLQNPNLDRKMCGLDASKTEETVCDETERLRTAALVFSIVSSVGLVPHLLSLYTRVTAYLTPGTETDRRSLEHAAGLLTCIIIAEDIPQIVISAV